MSHDRTRNVEIPYKRPGSLTDFDITTDSRLKAKALALGPLAPFTYNFDVYPNSTRTRRLSFLIVHGLASHSQESNTCSMKEASPDPPNIDGSRSGAQPAAPTAQGLNEHTNNTRNKDFNEKQNGSSGSVNGGDRQGPSRNNSSLLKALSAGDVPSHTSSQAARPGSVLETPNKAEEPSQENPNPTSKMNRFFAEVKRSVKISIFHSWLNILLIFVPVGIAVSQVDGINGGIVFGLNAVAIIPLAGLLAYATESVARKMGDALGALLNVTFGNAVELIIFISALAKNEIRIVQASLLGSILANLLLILGMSMLLGGLRFREQVYNSTVTQMSACLLSLSVISLVLPTAFHASFRDNSLADQQSLKISRGTSIVLLLVYVIYLMFQLKSHAYMYESTPQHIIDAELAPGPAAGLLDSSSSDDSSSSSSDSSDSDSSHGTMRKKMKKVLRNRRHRRSSTASVDTADTKGTRTASFTTASTTPQDEVSEATASRHRIPRFPSYEGNESAIEEEDEEEAKRSRRRRRYRRHRHRKSKKQARDAKKAAGVAKAQNELPENVPQNTDEGEPRRVDFAVQDDLEAGPSNTSKRPFPLRGLSVKNIAPVFAEKSTVTSTPVPHVRYGIRRTNSLPDRLQFRAPGAMLPSSIPPILTAPGAQMIAKEQENEEEHLTQTGAIILLLASTGLVAVCAEFLVDSIKDVVKSSSVNEVGIGLIILPIVGNAAEHVTAIKVAYKNHMDLAIGVAVGSSIQIALLLTPVMVILGWIMDKDMSLYFTLFETVCLFVSAFIVNFLVLDGRSNYLEGALLCAVYIIIAVVAFFYPNKDEASEWGGGT
ncbi:vacuolar calcium ion transporter [Fusarium tjaetaba]|uniref:Vacuolar calcium ion transporter n=1 Tax=Fusarium tjaetaba TaxID=1567544 RepID=A0A8H5RHG5_9HYPO|nr:vacuolar calcium ion transporter [Fusarium tjaetaba]KAF5632001.1 vacuolar calcium ion transporter [Fusarium tjaetaba]